jgi:Transglutaminase-like superfamily
MGRSVSDLEAQAAAVGGTLVETTIDSQGRLVGTFEIPDIDDGAPFATAQLLENLAASDVAAGAIPPDVVARVQSMGPAGLLAWVQSHVRFELETTETFASPLATFDDGFGDCDDSARVFVVLSRCAGWPARFVYFTQSGQPAHVCAQVWTPGPADGAAGAWQWAETTIAARLGEHPFAAAQRLGKGRPDLDGSPVVLVNGQPVPLPGGIGALGFQPKRRRSMGNLASYDNVLGAGFPQALVDYSAEIGADPLDVLKLLLSESGLNPRADNSIHAVGINQLIPMNYGYITNAGYTVDQYKALTAEQQLPVVFAYFQNVLKNHHLTSISGRDLYWLNFLPAYYVPGATDLHVIVTSSSGFYQANQSFDHGKKGFITAGDLQLSLDAQEAAHPTYWPLLSAAILAQEGGPTVPIAAVLLGLGLFVGASLADSEWTRPILQNLGLA